MRPDFNDIFRIETNNIKPRKGRILISEPFSVGDIFRHSVVLLVEYSKEQGALGFILNKPVEGDFTEFYKDYPSRNIRLSAGGPVAQDKIFYIHTANEDIIPGSQYIKDGLYWGGEYLKLKEAINNDLLPAENVRFFVGYSGWSPRQLEDELKRNAWLVKDISVDEVFKPIDNLWTKQINKLDDKYKMWKFVPENPDLN